MRQDVLRRFVPVPLFFVLLSLIAGVYAALDDQVAIADPRFLLTSASVLSGFLLSCLLFLSKESLALAAGAEDVGLGFGGQRRRRALRHLSLTVAYACWVAIATVVVLSLQLAGTPSYLTSVRDALYQPILFAVGTHLFLSVIKVISDLRRLSLELQESSGAIGGGVRRHRSSDAA